jgi:hypothetical protein
MSIKNPFQRLFHKKNQNKKFELVTIKTDWSEFFSGKEMI